MPFSSPQKKRQYMSQYQAACVRGGARKKEPESLVEALVELRELRKMVQQQRKRIWFLEHREEHNMKQIRRRRAVYSEDAGAMLRTAQKIIEQS